jgi:hypothetical protein
MISDAYVKYIAITYDQQTYLYLLISPRAQNVVHLCCILYDGSQMLILALFRFVSLR